MKQLALTLIAIPLMAFAGPEPAPTPTPFSIESLGATLFAAKSASFVVSPALMGSNRGFGLAVLYPVSEYAFAGVRLDYFNSSFTVPSAIVGARYTLKNIRFEPTVVSYGGLIMALGGAGEQNHVVAATTGIGASATLWHNDHLALSAIIAAEKWTNQTNPVIRPALALSATF